MVDECSCTLARLSLLCCEIPLARVYLFSDIILLNPNLQVHYVCLGGILLFRCDEDMICRSLRLNRIVACRVGFVARPQSPLLPSRTHNSSIMHGTSGIVSFPTCVLFGCVPNHEINLLHVRILEPHFSTRASIGMAGLIISKASTPP